MLESGRQLAFDGLVVATGAVPRTLGGANALAGVITLRRLEDAERLRALLGPGVRLVVVGGGFLGMEVAATARGLGAEVTVVEPQAAPLRGCSGRSSAGRSARSTPTTGSTLRTGVGVAGLVGRGRVEGVRLDDGSIVGADVVLVAIGVVPETAWLAGSGLELADGVVCAPTLLAPPGSRPPATSPAGRHPLARDVRLEHRTNAAEQGVHAASSLLAGAGRRPSIRCRISGPTSSTRRSSRSASPGRPTTCAWSPGRSPRGASSPAYGRDGRLSAVVGFNSPRQLMGFRALLDRRAALRRSARASAPA